jgi:hypothetical protein
MYLATRRNELKWPCIWQRGATSSNGHVVGSLCAARPPSWGERISADRVNIYLGEVAVMFTTLAFILIAVLLMLGVIADSLWGRFQRR